MDYTKKKFHDFPWLLSSPKNYSRTFQTLVEKDTFFHDFPDCMNPNSVKKPSLFDMRQLKNTTDIFNPLIHDAPKWSGTL